jgi:hypothetical protein
MQKPVDALVTGFTKSPELLLRSLASLRRLKHEGIIRNIHCVTWDSPELDPFVAPLHDIAEVQLTRVRQPQAAGNANQRGVVYQVENLEAALKLVPNDALILKWRPDFVARHAFLRDKIVSFDAWSAVPANNCFGVSMPPNLFQKKIWIPWADCNTPFFFEDAVFFGSRRDVEKLATPITQADLAILEDMKCGWYAHVVRYSKLFVSRYPLIENYVKQFGLFPQDVDHRLKAVPHMASDGFFWHLLVAHAWIMHTQFHVDIGQAGDLSFYANAVNRDADWSRPETLKVAAPYDDPAGWRVKTSTGLALPIVRMAFGRLMDDAWQRALFTRDVPDLPHSTLVPLLENIACCRDGRLGSIEADFYLGAQQIHRDYQTAHPR